MPASARVLCSRPSGNVRSTRPAGAPASRDPVRSESPAHRTRTPRIRARRRERNLPCFSPDRPTRPCSRPPERRSNVSKSGLRTHRLDLAPRFLRHKLPPRRASAVRVHAQRRKASARHEARPRAAPAQSTLTAAAPPPESPRANPICAMPRLARPAAFPRLGLAREASHAPIGCGHHAESLSQQHADAGVHERARWVSTSAGRVSASAVDVHDRAGCPRAEAEAELWMSSNARGGCPRTSPLGSLSLWERAG